MPFDTSRGGICRKCNKPTCNNCFIRGDIHRLIGFRVCVVCAEGSTKPEPQANSAPLTRINRIAMNAATNWKIAESAKIIKIEDCMKEP